MAQLDLRNALVKIYDGYAGSVTGTMLVNLMAGYSSGATTMAVDGSTGTVTTGDTFLVAGDTVVHTITSHVETSSNTTSITFTPGLGSAVVDDAVITFQPHNITIKIGDGTMTYDEKIAYKYTLDRGLLDTVRKTDDQPMEVKLDAIWEFLTADTGNPPTIEDALKQRGNASGWVSSSPDPCEPYCVNIQIEYMPPCPADKGEIILLPYFRYESLAHDLKQGMFTVSGKCNVIQATATRVTNTYPTL